MNPIILAVDDDPQVLKAVEMDLRRHYADRFTIMTASSGETALELVEQIRVRNEQPAMLLVDQRMPGMSGTEFLENAMKIFPDAKRALLTAYADTDAAISSINKAKIDYYLMKPWEPPQMNLYPILDDLIDDWLVDFRPPFEGIRLLGSRWARRSHEIRDFLTRNGMPYQWLDVETSEEGRKLLSIITSNSTNAAKNIELPRVLFPDGSQLASPSIAELASKIGLKTRAQLPFYDLIVVGGGPTGLAAGVYAGSEGLRTLVIESQAPGGQAGSSSNIENYLGFPSGLAGTNLARRAVTQVLKFGAEILSPREVCGIRIEGTYCVVKLTDGSEMRCQSLLISTGVSYRRLDDVPGLEKLTGSGVYYGASASDALLCKDQDVFIVGGANSAGQAAVHFSKYAKRVIMLIRSESLSASMSKYLIDQIAELKNIELWTRTRIVEVLGKDHLEAVTLEDSQNGKIQTMSAQSLYIFIGAKPRTEWLEGVIERDENGFILTGSDLLLSNGSAIKSRWPLDRSPFFLETNIPGIFAAGDVRHGSIKRVASGVGEGAMVVHFVHQYLGGL